MSEISTGPAYARPLSDTDPSTGESAGEKASAAKDAAADVAGNAKQAASDVASTATDAARDVAEQTKQQAGDLLAQTRDQLGEQVGVQQGAVVSTLRDLGDQLAAMTDNAEQDGTAVELAGQARDRARSAADWLDGRDPSDVLDELRRFGRERPGTFLLGALVAGVAAGRLTRGVVAVHTDDNTSGDGKDRQTADAPWSASGPGARPSPTGHQSPTGVGQHGFTAP